MKHVIFDIEYDSKTLFNTIPDTKFIKIIESAIELLHFKPDILDKINEDQDKAAKEKKKLRIADKRYYQKMTEDLSNIEITEEIISDDQLELLKGRERMNPQVVYLFMIIRGCFGSITSADSIERMCDSHTLNTILNGWSITMPGITTILENINYVSNTTREYITDAQIEFIMMQGLDDFSKIIVDSTHVKASTEWPTDSKILFALLSRAYNYSQKLNVFGVSDFKRFWMPAWLIKLGKLLFKINITAGKAKSKGKIKKMYRQFLTVAQQAHDYLINEVERLEGVVISIELCPSKKRKLKEVWAMIKNDITDAANVLYYTEERVFNDVVLPSTRKILSISDRSAAFIQKGNRNPVIGYKPQIARSGNGFIPAIIVPEGNESDSGKLVPIIETIINKTSIIPCVVSTDDGYASRQNRDTLLALGVKIVSINGSKGKTITPLADWDSEDYKNARADRSAVESIIFTLKYVYDFGNVRRRGIEEVRAELLEKVMAYNFNRIVVIRNRMLLETKEKNVS